MTLLPLVGLQDGDTLHFDDSTASADGRSYYYRVVPATVFDTEGAASATSRVTMPDRTPPAPPVVEQAVGEPAAAVLNWRTGSEPDLAGYRIYRRSVLANNADKTHLAFGDETRITTALLAPDITQYRDTDVVPGHVYQYELTAIDKSENESAHSPPVLARPRDVSPPHQPVGLSVKVGEKGRVVLAWTANTDADLYAYRIYRAADEGKLTLVRELPLSALGNGSPLSHAEMLDPQSESDYRFAVSAVDATENESPLSDTVNVKLPDMVPPQQPVLTGLKAENGAIVLSWASPPSNDVAGYQIYRGEADGKLASVNDTLLAANVLTYRDAKVKAGVVYRYAVGAVDRSGNRGALSDVQSTVTYAAVEPVAPSALRLDKTGAPWRLVWQASDKATGFIAYVATGRDGDYHQVGTLIAKRSVGVQMPSATPFWYRIQAVFPGGAVSALSDPIAVAPPIAEGGR